MREGGAVGRALVAVLAVSGVALPAAQAEGLKIGSVQSIAPVRQGPPAVPPGQEQRAGAQELRFEAFGRQFKLELADNPRIRGNADLEVLEGRVAGFAGSWVRLTRYDGGWHGVIYDGAEYYGVDQAAHSGRFNAQAAKLSPKETVIYRWRDAQVDADFHGDVVAAPKSMAALADGVEAELPPPEAMAATSVPVTREITVGLVVDAEQVTRDGGESAAAAAAKSRLNIADGILSTQTGIRLRAVDPVSVLPASQAGFSTTDAKALLEALRSWRGSSSAQGSLGLSHLFTGKDILEEGNAQTVGIAYYESACKSSYAASLAEGRRTTSFDGLIAAHEIGHTLGAPHDAESGSACASTPTGFLMGTTVTTQSTELSDCSLTQIRTYTGSSAASCIVPVNVADVAVGAPSSARIALGQNSILSFTVRSGNLATAGVRFTLTLPSNVTLIGVAGGDCGASDASLVQCSLGDLPANATRELQVTVRADQAGDSIAVAEATATNDAVSGNNGARVRLNASGGADLSSTVTATPDSIAQGASAAVQITLRNAGLGDVTDAQLSVTLDPGLVAQTAQGTGVSCSVGNGAVSCTPASLAAGASATVQLQVQANATASGPQKITVGLRSTITVDPVLGNNDTSTTVTVNAPAPAPPPAPAPTQPSGGGGGGGLDLAVLLALSAALAALLPRRLRRAGTLGLLAAAVGSLPAPRAQAERLPLWELGLGAGALGFSDYRGADTSHVYPLPVPYVVYRGRYLQADRDGVRGLLLDRPRATLGLSANATTPVNSDDIRARAGMPDLKPTVELGPSLDLHLWRGEGERLLLDLRLPLRATVTAEQDPRYIGWQFAPRLNLDIRDPFGLQGWNLGALVGPLYAERRYHEYYYSVAPAWATSQRPAYRAAGGYAGAQLLLSTSRRFAGGWFGAFARYDRLDGASFLDSPLVRRRSAWMAGLGYAWIFARSGRLVDTGR